MTTARSTVVVVTWRGARHLTACLDALAAQRSPHRALVVDNGSTDGTAELLAAHPSAPEVLRLPVNAGYAGAMAVALHRVRTPFMAWLNDDAAPDPGWLGALEAALDRDPAAAAASSVLRAPDGRVQSSGVRLTADGHGADVPRATEVFGFCGGAALLRTEVLRAAGGVPAHYFCYYEDTDTAWRFRLAGRSVVAVPEATAVHLHGASSAPGSAPFHRWNERNRLLTLLRCAPGRVAARELARFAAITAALPLRRAVPDAANFRVPLRLRVLAEVLRGLPAALRVRRAAGDARARARVWRDWAGR
ncbi:glycosyltransferase family 2 protein [Saccharopolyspora cebuensis]|uniref:Glycosyltransferase family 2 protein n=1 Tax=Saccharopolyspora cebuensis TaxID=418759 RepID=A0ABV4CLT8_9PSEU